MKVIILQEHTSTFSESLEERQPGEIKGKKTNGSCCISFVYKVQGSPPNLFIGENCRKIIFLKKKTHFR